MPSLSSAAALAAALLAAAGGHQSEVRSSVEAARPIAPAGDFRRSAAIAADASAASALAGRDSLEFLSVSDARAAASGDSAPPAELVGGEPASSAADSLTIAALRAAPYDVIAGVPLPAAAGSAGADKSHPASAFGVHLAGAAALPSPAAGPYAGGGGTEAADEGARLGLPPAPGDQECRLSPTAFEVTTAAGGFVEPADALRLTWRLGLVAGEGSHPRCRGRRPSSHRIVVRCGAVTGLSIWDTGRAPYDGNSAVIPCDLPPDEACRAELSIWSADDSPAQATAEFRVALPSGQRPWTPGYDPPGGAWEGLWISGGTQLRGKFDLHLPPGVQVESAVAYASGVGCFSLSVNGRPLLGTFDGEVGDSFLDPGFSTVFSHRLLYRALDVKDHLLNGSNIFGVRLGMCTFGYLMSYCPEANPWTPACRAFLLQMNVRLSDGRRMNFTSSSDTSLWHATTAGNPIYYTHMYHGEMYNASREQAGWDRPGGPTPEPPIWRPAIPYPFAADLGALSLMTIPPIRIRERRSGLNFYNVRTSSVPDGWVWVWDFGQNWAGFAALKVRGLDAGTRLVLRYAEILDDAGLPRNQYCPSWCREPPFASFGAINVANQTDVFITSGRQEETFVPSFTYHGYRYVSLEGLPPGYLPQSDTLTSMFVHTDVPANGNVRFLDRGASLLNRIQGAVQYTQASNLHSIPTDCPQREKRGWMGDAQWTSAQASRNFGTAEFYRNFAKSFHDTQHVGCTQVSAESSAGGLFGGGGDASLPAQVSTEPWAGGLLGGGSDASRPACYQCCSKSVPSFGCAWTGVTDDFTDNGGSLPDVVPYPGKPFGGWPGDPTWAVAAAEIPYQSWKMSGDDAALAEAYPQAKALVDFLTRHMDVQHGLLQFGYYGDWCSTRRTPVTSVSAYSHIRAVRRLQKIAALLNLTADAEEYAQLDKRLLRAWHHAYFDSANNSYAGGEQTGNAMALALGAPPTPEIERAVARRLAEDVSKHGPTTGGVGFRAIFEALRRGGELAAAIDLALRTEMPSIGQMLEQGPGTIWEVWDNSGIGFSWNHPMYTGGIGLFLYELAGLAHESSHGSPALRLYAEAVVRLRAATGSITVAGGVLRWAWRLQGESLEIAVSAPLGGPTARVELPRIPGLRRLTENGSLLWLEGENAPRSVHGILDVREHDASISLELAGGDYTFLLFG